MLHACPAHTKIPTIAQSSATFRSAAQHSTADTREADNPTAASMEKDLDSIKTAAAAGGWWCRESAYRHHQKRSDRPSLRALQRSKQVRSAAHTTKRS